MKKAIISTGEGLYAIFEQMSTGTIFFPASARNLAGILYACTVAPSTWRETPFKEASADA